MPKRNPRIAIVEPVGGHGGMFYYDFGLCEGLAAAGADVVLHTCDKTRVPPSLPFQIRHTFVGVYGKSPPWIRGVRFIIGSMKTVLLSVWEGRKIIHYHFFHVSSLELMNIIFARLAMRKVIITAHDVESFVASLEVPVMSRLAYRLAHRVIAHNVTSQQEIMDYTGLLKDHISVIPHGNYLHAIPALPPQTKAREQMGILAGAKAILFFGQIKEVKGLDLLLKAMPSVLEAHPEALLLIAGRPWKTDFSIYDELIERLGIRDRCITHIRYIPDEDVSLYYSAADLVVLPYRQIYQSGVLLMTMSYGRAVLASDLPGMTELIEDGRNGFLFRQMDEGDLASRLISILSDDGLRQDVAKLGFEYVRDHHDWILIGEKTKELYASIDA